MNIIGITLIFIVLFLIWGGFLNVSDNRKKKKESDERFKKHKKDLETFIKNKKEYQPTIEESIIRQKNAIEKTDKKQLIDWYKKALILCHPNEFKDTLNKLKKIHSVLANHIPTEEFYTSRPPSEHKPPNNPAAMYYEDAKEKYKEYGYEKLFSGHLNDIYRKRGVGGNLAWQYFSPFECVTVLYKKIYLKQHQENLHIETAIKKELKKIIDNFDAWKSQAIKDMEVYANTCRALTLKDLLYFQKGHPSSPNFSHSDPTNPFDFPWHNSRKPILYAPKLITTDDGYSRLAPGYREDFYENRQKYYDEWMNNLSKSRNIR